MKNFQRKRGDAMPIEPPITDPRLYCCVCLHFFDNDKERVVDATKKHPREADMIKKKHKELEVCVINLQRDIDGLRR